MFLVANADKIVPYKCNLSEPILHRGQVRITTEEQKELKEKMLVHSSKLRQLKISNYYLPEYNMLDSDCQSILRLAAGNAGEIYQLINQAPEEHRQLYLAMLLSLDSKDYLDLTSEILKKHFLASLPYRNKRHFINEILCPRIENEMLENWRDLIRNTFSQTQKEIFATNPSSLMDYLVCHYPDGIQRYYSVLSISPSVSLKLGYSDRRGRNILFTAILRTLGIPSRINKIDGEAEYYQNGRYYRADKQEDYLAILYLIPQNGKRFVYGRNYSISRLDGREYRRMKFLDNSQKQLLIPGQYRLLTANRLPNGNQKCIITYFSLNPGEKAYIPLTLQEALPAEMLSIYKLAPFALQDLSGKAVLSKMFLQCLSIIIFLDTGKEPTEHVLNEIIEHAAEFNAKGESIHLFFVIQSHRELSDKTLRKAMETVHQASLFIDCSGGAALARKMYLEPGILPLLVLTDASHCGYYATCGYQVGTIELIQQLINCIQS